MNKKFILLVSLLAFCTLTCTLSFSAMMTSPHAFQLTTFTVAGTGTSEVSPGGYKLLDVGIQAVGGAATSGTGKQLQVGGLYPLVADYVATARVHNITRGISYTSLAAALADAQGGNIIELDDGLYSEFITNWPAAQNVVVRSHSGVADNVSVTALGLSRVFDLSSLSPSISGAIQNITIASGNAGNGNGGGINLPAGSVFQVTGCSFEGNTAANGAAMANGSATNCTFVNNTANNSGGGLYNGSATNCFFMGNTANSTGGATANSSATGCTFSSNSASLGGGSYNAPSLDRCKFLGNSAPDGSEIYMSNSSTTTIVNCLVNGSGSSMLARAGSFSTNVTNCTFFGGDVVAHTGSTVNMKNSIVWNGALNPESGALILKSYSDIQNGNTSNNCIIDDPAFIDASTGNFRLGLGSPCIDKGDSSGAPAVDRLMSTASGRWQTAPSGLASKS